MRNALAAMAMAVAALGLTAPMAHADTATVDGVDYPLCAVEDCSDQPGQVGIWTDKSGEQWLSLGEHSLHISN